MKNILTVLILLFTQTINAQKVKTFFEIGVNHGHVKQNSCYTNDNNSYLFKPAIGFNLGLKIVSKIDERFDFKTGFYLFNNQYKMKATYIIPSNFDFVYNGIPKTNYYFVNGMKKFC